MEGYMGRDRGRKKKEEYSNAILFSKKILKINGPHICTALLY